jgi:hypothetical protein
MLDNPCKSPDWPPERAANPSGSNATVSTLWLFPRTFIFFRAFFFAIFFFVAALWPSDLFAVVRFSLLFFLFAIFAVYH